MNFAYIFFISKLGLICDTCTAMSAPDGSKLDSALETVISVQLLGIQSCDSPTSTTCPTDPTDDSGHIYMCARYSGTVSIAPDTTDVSNDVSNSDTEIGV